MKEIINNKIRAIIFDLDGVLIEAKEIHFEALNIALGNEYKITWEEHIKTYDGLKTKEKLNILTQDKGLPAYLHQIVWEKKQKITEELFRKNLNVGYNIKDCIQKLKEDGYIIMVCTNSISKTLELALMKLGIEKLVDFSLANEDVANSKPHPQIYWDAMSKCSLTPDEVLILEDSPVGLFSAANSSAKIMRISSPVDVTYDNIKAKISEVESEVKNKVPRWDGGRLNVVIPMAGAGSRFKEAGYKLPKPLIDVKGRPMISWVVDNINIDADYIFLVQKAHKEEYLLLESILKQNVKNCTIVEVDGMTEGAACTVLLAEEYINNGDPLFIANSDQFVEWNSNEFMYKMNEGNFDGGIVTFKANHPKWSYAKIGDDGYVREVAEKNPISDDATVGFYYWKRGFEFVKYAKQMMDKNIRVNNEFYVCPVFNEAILDNKKIVTHPASKMWGMGTPEDLEFFLKNKLNEG